QTKQDEGDEVTGAISSPSVFWHAIPRGGGHYSTPGSCSNGEIEKELLQGLYRRSKNLTALENVASFFGQPAQLSQAARCAPFRVLCGEVEKLKHPLECFVEAVALTASECANSSFELTSDVAQLFAHRETEPPSLLKFFVNGSFHLT